MDDTATLSIGGNRLAGVLESVPQGRDLQIENVALLLAFQGGGCGKRFLKLAGELTWYLKFYLRLL
jgi:hypothetical protein